MEKNRPIRILGGAGTTIDSLFERLPNAVKSKWMDDLTQLKQWYDDGFVGLCMDYPAMFWPCFVECDRCVVLNARSPGSLMGIWLEPEQGNRQAVEKELNSVYIGFLFTGYPADPSPGQVIWMARLLKKMWGWKLNYEFPHRNILVAFDEGASDVLRSYITFYQVPAT